MNLPPSSATSRANSGVSRLAMMQARFQAQQLVEREKKLINLLEERQEDVVRRIAYGRDSSHSANSLSSNNSSNSLTPSVGLRPSVTGRLTRGQTANPLESHHGPSPVGWDKSYPLKPVGADPGLPPSNDSGSAPRPGLYKRNSMSGLSNVGVNKYSGNYGPRSSYVQSQRGRGLSLDRLSGGRYASNGGSVNTSPTRRPSYGITRTRSQAQLLGHSSGEDSYGSSSRPPSTYDTYSRTDVNLNRSHSHLYGSRNVNSNGNGGVLNPDWVDVESPASPPGNRKTSYTREYVRNLPSTVASSVASAPAARGRLSRRQRDTSPGRTSYEHSSYSSQSSDKSENGTNQQQPAFSVIPTASATTAPIIPNRSFDSNTTSRQPVTSSNDLHDVYTYESRPRINSETFRKSRSPGGPGGSSRRTCSRSPSRSPDRFPFGADDPDRVNNNECNNGNNDYLPTQQRNAREREEEKRRLQAEMRRREQELLAKIKEQQKELESMKHEKGKVERELHRQELMRDRERKVMEEAKRDQEKERERERLRVERERNQAAIERRATQRQNAKSQISRSSSNATTSSTSRPDDVDEVLEEDADEEEVDLDPFPNRRRGIGLGNLRRPQKTTAYITNGDDNAVNISITSTASSKKAIATPPSPGPTRRSRPNASPAPTRRTRSDYASPAPRPNQKGGRRTEPSPAPARRQRPDPSPAPTKARNTRGEPITQSSLRAAANPNASPKKQTSKPPVRSRLAPKPRDDLVECRNCGRNFAEDRIERHTEICIKTSKTKRKAFDMSKKRIQGTEAENFASNKRTGRFAGGPAAAASKNQPPKKKSDWRKKRAEFIAALRAAKEAQRYVAAGGKISDLPPPPRSDNSDYVPCPHCGRKFNESAADRHIPKCKDIKSNKRR